MLATPRLEKDENEALKDTVSCPFNGDSQTHSNRFWTTLLCTAKTTGYNSAFNNLDFNSRSWSELLESVLDIRQQREHGTALPHGVCGQQGCHGATAPEQGQIPHPAKTVSNANLYP